MDLFKNIKKLFGDEESISEKKKVSSIFGTDSPEVMLNNNLYRYNGYTIEEKSNNSGKWRKYTTLPVICKDIKVSDDGKLLVKGELSEINVGQIFKDSLKSAVDGSDINEKYEKWYKIEDNGNIEFAPNSKEPDHFIPIGSKEGKVIVNKKECYCKVYEISPREPFYSSDRVHWEKLDDFPNDFKRFRESNSKKFSFAQDVKGHSYVYWNGWTRVEFEEDLEIFKDDLFYNKTNEIFYKYQNDKKEIISKRIHLLFVEGEIGNIGSSVLYVKEDGSLDHHSSLPGILGKMPQKVESLYGEVFITMENDKRYIFYDNDWVESMKWNMGYGPFFFKTSLNENDPIWNVIGTDIESIEDGKEKVDKRRPVYFKILKDECKLVYYSTDGKSWFKHSELPAQYKSLTSTAYLRYAKTFETVVYTDMGHFQLVQVPSGFFKRTYRNVWEEYNEKNLLIKYSGDYIIPEFYLQIYDLGEK